jgi:hypothetical protein
MLHEKHYPIIGVNPSKFNHKVRVVNQLTHDGLYFTSWDKLLGTQDLNDEKQFDQRLTGNIDGA